MKTKTKAKTKTNTTLSSKSILISMIQSEFRKSKSAILLTMSMAALALLAHTGTRSRTCMNTRSTYMNTNRSTNRSTNKFFTCAFSIVPSTFVPQSQPQSFNNVHQRTQRTQRTSSNNLFSKMYMSNTNSKNNQNENENQNQNENPTNPVKSIKSTKTKKPKTTTTVSYIEPSLSGYKPPTVNWYPGHIAKAERTLSETLTSADVLLEIRDARIPKATSHPRVREWTVGKPRIVVLSRVDTVPKSSIREWSDALNLFGAGKWDQFIQDGNLRHRARQNRKSRGIHDNSSDHNSDGDISNNNYTADDGLVEDVIYVDAKRGSGMPNLLRAIGRAGAYVNKKRLARGLRERPLRVAVLGYPNVG